MSLSKDETSRLIEMVKDRTPFAKYGKIQHLRMK